MEINLNKNQEIKFYQVTNASKLKTLFIFFDEKGYNQKDFEKNNNNSLYFQLRNKFTNLFLNKPNDPIKTSMLVVCTQNSKSCSKDHFQNMIETMLLEDLKDDAIHLIDKADATSTNNSSTISCARTLFGRRDKPFNCRTRIYCNSKIFSPKYKKNNGIVIKDIPYIKSINNIKESKSCIWVAKCEKRIISFDANGNGGILFDIILKNQNNRKIQRFIICNSNLLFDESNNILEKLTDSSININTNNELDYNLEIIMATPNEYITKKIMVNPYRNNTTNKNKNIVSRIRQKLGKKSKNRKLLKKKYNNKTLQNIKKNWRNLGYNNDNDKQT
jgi:hypothetical protein